MAFAEGFPPIARPDARVLILGSLPGRRSIAEQQYYAHPQNSFWKIMGELFGTSGDYDTRCRRLVDNRIALWDVLHSSVRPGSMDADIRVESASVNDFASFFEQHASIDLIAFNGKKAEELFARFVDASIMPDRIMRTSLPSTSPAYATMPFSAKLEIWRVALAGKLQE